MFEVGPRQSGKCFFCPDKTEVVTFTKDGQTVKLCRRHLWDALQVTGEKEGRKDVQSTSGR